MISELLIRHFKALKGQLSSSWPWPWPTWSLTWLPWSPTWPNLALVDLVTNPTKSTHNPSLIGGRRKVVTPNFQILIALKWNIWWFPTCCTLGHIYTLCILGPKKISKFSLYLSYSLVTKWTKYSYQTRVNNYQMSMCLWI